MSQRLPPRLLERLKRRGIIKKASDTVAPKPQANKHNNYGIEADPEHEEIIAEDYSESSGDDETPTTNDCDTGDDLTQKPDLECRQETEQEDNRLIGEEAGDNADDNQMLEQGSVMGCPNKYNIYHECSKFCRDHYSCPDSVVPTLEQRKQLALILRDYPLPNEWQVVYDPGVKTFYFWNIVTNLVTWVPPVMNGYLSISADEIRRSLSNNIRDEV